MIYDMEMFDAITNSEVSELLLPVADVKSVAFQGDNASRISGL